MEDPDNSCVLVRMLYTESTTNVFIIFCIYSQVIEKIAWDASGERLAVSYKDGDELYRGLIAIFDVKRAPLISTSLM